MLTTHVSRIIAAPPEEIWSVLADIEHAERWNGGWAQIEITSGQREGVGATFRAHTEDGHAFDFEVTAWEKPFRIAFSPIRHPDSERYPIRLESHAFILQPIDTDKTHVRLLASASFHGFKGRLVGMFLWSGHQRRGIEAALDNLQSLFEGEEEDEA